jgi:MtN3 and saliva related transmembrane protein
MVDVLGFVAGTLTALAFLPQVLRTWRRRSADDLSTLMLTAQASGVALWIGYGVAVGAAPVIIANSVTLALTLLLLLFKQKYGTR